MNADEMKRTMSVPEMRKLLGIKKTESYWLVHKNYFKTELINGTMRVDIASFEKWYANQTKHKKITGEKPGAQLCAASYSFRDVANMLGEYDGTIYDLWNRKCLPTVTVNYRKRIPREIFDRWYENQNEYHKVDGPATIEEIEEKFILFREAVAMLKMSNEELLKVSDVNNHFVEKYYRDLGKMKAAQGANNKKNEGNVTPNTVFEIHKILRSCFRQAVKWGIMEKNPAVDATLPKRTKKKREIWTAETLMQAIEACDEKWLEAAFHLAFTATLRLGEVLALTWDCVEISEEAIEENRCFIVINKIIERVSIEALEALEHKDVITVFPSKKKNNRTVLIMKTPKTETSNRKVYIPSHVGKCLVELKKEQDQTRELLGSEYKDYNLVLATSFGMPIGGSHLRDKMQEIIEKEGLPDVVFHSLRHTSVTYKLKLSGGDIKAVQGDSGHAQADMVTEVYGHIMDEDRKKNAQMMEKAFYNKENLNPDMHGQAGVVSNNSISVPGGIDAELLVKVLENPEMAALLTSLAKTMKIS